MTTDSERPLEPGTVVARNYRVTQRLGAGGMGTVYLAENLTLNQRVVVKVLRGGDAGAGQEEAQMLANLQHPNVVTVYAHDPALDCIVMEYLDGASLGSLLEKGIDRVNAIRVALAVAEALAAVHKRGLVHRDFKPDNVMLALNQGGGGRFVDWLKLIDFGTALKVGKVPPVLLGTPEFCPPEQFHPEGAQPANDVYALGSCIFLMMTGVFPFDVPREDLSRAHHEDPPPSLLERLVGIFGRSAFDPRTHALLEDLSELVQQMLAKVPSERPSAQEVARRLTRLESSFAEAGTYVGSKTSSPALEEVKAPAPKKKTSVLTREHQVKRYPTTDRTAPRAQNDVSTKPHLPPVSVPERAAPTTSSIARDAVRVGPPRAAIAGLVAVVLALVGALVFLPSTPKEDVVTPPPREPLAAVDAGPAAEALDAGTALAEARVDAGVASSEETEELAALPTGTVLKPKPAPAAPKVECRFDAKFAAAARAEFSSLSTRVPPAQRDSLEDRSDELAEALEAKDCRKTRAVLNKLNGLVRASPK